MASDYQMLWFPDMHEPMAHREAVLAACRLAEDILRPQDVFGQIGDLTDFASVSRHPRSWGQERSFYTELVNARGYLSEMWCATKRSKRRVVTCGNHETWLYKYVASRADQLEELIEELAGQHTIPGVLKFPKDVKFFPYNEHVTVGNVLFRHDQFSSLQQTAGKAGTNVAYGHTHRAGIMYSGDVEGDHHVTVNMGMLADAEAMVKTYARRIGTHDWQLSVAHFDVSEYGTIAQLIPYVNGAFCFRGKAYTGKTERKFLIKDVRKVR